MCHYKTSCVNRFTKKPNKTKHVSQTTVRNTRQTSFLTRTGTKENNALPHHNCSGSQLFCTSNPTALLSQTQIQSEAEITREAKQVRLS